MNRFKLILPFIVVLFSFNAISQDLALTEKTKKIKKTKKTKVKKKKKNAVDTSVPPSKHFDLSSWSLSVPTDADENGKADQVYGEQLNTNYSNEYFYASPDGGMVFKCPIDGYKTSKNTTYTRSELREMLRKNDNTIKTKGPNKNNWVLKSSPNVKTAGGYDGVLKATLAVNHVTTTGDPKHVGRVIIGQIHASDDEPLRIYYRKLPGSRKGSIYFAHEGRANGSEDFYELIGSKDDKDVDPHNGIALNEKFSYEVQVIDNILSVSIIRPNKPPVQRAISMASSGYNIAGEYMYFKAGVYNQNKTGRPSDYVQATFYKLTNEHKTMSAE